MEHEELIATFFNMDITDKRNAYNEEILRLYETIKSFFNYNNQMEDKLYNYHISNDKYLNEEEYLTKEYENLIKIRELFLSNAIKMEMFNRVQNND